MLCGAARHIILTGGRRLVPFSTTAVAAAAAAAAGTVPPTTTQPDNPASPSRPLHEIEADIHDVLESLVRPYAQSDGGDVRFDRFCEETGTLWVRMEGACEDCASSTITLRFKVLNAMQLYCSEVEAVSRVDIDEDSGSDSGSDDDECD